MPELKDAKAAHWQREIEEAKKRYRTFLEDGDAVVDAYRLQKADGNGMSGKDKYNILYSSTETIRPNLYAQMPKVRATLRNKDTASNVARVGSLLLEGCVEYVKDEEDFDSLMDNVVEDFLLPGMGVGWVRYEARFEDKTDDKGAKVLAEGGKPGEYQQSLLDEMVKIEYVYWGDFLTGQSRVWKETPWVAKRLWLTKGQATKRFGKEKANKLTYTKRDNTGRDSADNPSETAEAWEIWDRESRTAYWYAESLPELLDEKLDPLKLKNFFPCPRPIRAISNTRTFVPRALYSQYKSQAETLNVLTKRIRLLGEALRVVGLYDGSQIKLADILNPTAGNRMIAVDNWAMFAQNGGINGAVVWLPIDMVSKVLTELLQQREVCKNEIYEITGFSDIVRGVSKASETLGAQNLKANWASARLKKAQKEVQRFARDMLALVGELIAEHCSPETIAVFSALEIPEPGAVQNDPKLQQQVQLFTQACEFIKKESRRVSTINIETDSTLMADDAIDREDRAKFLAASGAFLQQAVPALEATPELGPLLGALLMFTARSFPSARIIEDEFENVQKAMANRPPPSGDKDGKQATAAAAQAKLQQDGANAQAELQQKAQAEAAKDAREREAENNRHMERMEELALKREELALKAREVAVKEQEAKTSKFTAMHEAGMAEETLASTQEREAQDADREDAHKEADREIDLEAMDREDAHKEADRDAQAEAQEADREAAAEEGPPEGSEAP